MNFSIGDRVSFLNEKGGGIIVSIKDKFTVVVSDDDGFTTPYAIKHLVKINVAVVKPEINTVQFPNLAEDDKQIGLVFIPKDNTNLLQCNLDLKVVNNSGSNFYFELYQIENNKLLQFCSGQLADGMTHYVKTINREEIEAFTKIRFQCLFNSAKKMEAIFPLVQELNFKASKFYKESSYTYSKLVSNLALSFVLANTEDLERLKQKSLPDSMELYDKDTVPEEKKSKPNDYLRKDVEIDLHIAEILEDQMGVNPLQLLQIQLNFFKKELDKAIALNYASITFIHGIGKGVLKQAIYAALDKYQGINYYPANFHRYGNGATKVEII